MIKKVIKAVLAVVGLEIKKITEDTPLNKQRNDTMSMAIQRLKDKGILPDNIIDVGAAKGSWTNLSLGVWPDSNYILIEPIKEQIQHIPRNLSQNKKVEVIQAVAGEKEGEVQFSITDDLDGSGVYDSSSINQRTVKVVPLDSITAIRESDSIILKLDTHGFEVPIFEGAIETLKKTEAIIVEVYGFYVSPTGKLFHEVSAYLMERGFRLFDIVDVVRRPGDNAFWQADAVYLRKENSVFSVDSYR